MKTPAHALLQNDSFRCTANAVTMNPSPLAVTFELSGAYKQTHLETERCTKCRGYLSPYCEILSPGEQWRCALCGCLNVVSAPFVSRGGFLNQDGFHPLRNYQFNAENMRDARLSALRLELDASGVYLKRPTYVFIIECTSDAYKRGVVRSICGVLRENLGLLGKVHVSVVFFGKTACIVRRGGVLVVSDFDHLPSFDSDEVFFGAEAAPDFGAAADFLEKEATAENDLGGALNVAHGMLGKTGGTAVAFLSTIPNCGVGALSGRAASLRCKNDYFKTLAGNFSKRNISLSFCFFSCKNADIPSLSLPSRFTGGFISYFPNFDSSDETFPLKLDKHISAFFSKKRGFEGILKVRGRNVQIIDYFGNLHMKTSDVLSLCAVDFGHSITFSFRVANAAEMTGAGRDDDFGEVNKILNKISVENLSDAARAAEDTRAAEKAKFVNNFLLNADDWHVFQVALMYSDEDGNRKLRVNNFAVPVIRTRRKMINEYAMAHFVFLKAINEEMGGKPGLAVIDRFAEEERLDSMCKLLLSIKKSVVLRPVTYTPMDYRAFYIYLILNGSLKLLNRLMYPVLYDMKTKEQKDLTLESLEIDNFYILDAGYNFFFFVGTGIDSNSEVEEMVNECFQDSLTGRIILQEYENEYSKYLNNFVERLRKGTGLEPNFYYIRDDGSANVFKDIFFSYFYDDAGHNLESLDDYKRKLREKKKD